MKLITELSQNISVKKKKDTDVLYIEGVFSTAELLNNNGRKYKKETLEREIDKLISKVENKSLWGELGHPPNPEINPDKIAILTEKIEWDGNNVLGRSKLLDTPMGHIAKTLVKEGSLGISSRGLGTIDEKSNYVNDDYQMITWDLVTDPSNSPSWINGVYEGKDWSSPIKNEYKIPDEELIRNAKNTYHKRIWQVLENIEKSL
jgi:hypothetical protein